MNKGKVGSTQSLQPKFKKKKKGKLQEDRFILEKSNKSLGIKSETKG